MAKTYEPIATTTLGSANSTITFNSIPGTYTDLKIVLVGSTSATAQPFIRFNSDTGTNYSRTYFLGNGATVSSASGSGNDRIFLNGSGVWDSTYVYTATVDIFSYTASVYKTCLAVDSGDRNGAGASSTTVGMWRNTSAITSITLSPDTGNFNIGTTATLYGIKAA